MGRENEAVIARVFHEVVDQPPDERRPFLDRACGTDSTLRARVEDLLAALGMSDDVLVPRPGVITDDAATPLTIDDAPAPGRDSSASHIGRYKLLQLIGEGGFGSVFMAEQEHPVKRRVALKIIKPGMDTRQVIARFEAERQALAMMDHPNIAKVFDAGSTEAARPYFVMELVKGVPITDYCDREKLDARDRLKLFIQVCQAVQHAHQKGVIHRDLKPSNVLVSLHDGRPVPKVIDFGIAKATQARLTEKTLVTEFQQLVGTPEYMSPEQAEMSGLDIDTRTDIYSLGVLLYELLTGTTPLRSEELRSKGYAEIQRIIREVEPPRPSTRLAMLADTQVAAQRRTDAKTLERIVRFDLDWIVMKCLEKDRRRRYETANGLAVDVQRYLRNEPVAASPPSRRYRLRKFARRNRHLLGSAFVLLLMSFVAVGAVVRYAFQKNALAVERNAFLVDKDKSIADLIGKGRKTNTRLYDALLNHAEAVRLARLPGYRTTVWSDLRQAIQLDAPGRDMEDIKRQVLACLDDPIGLSAADAASVKPRADRRGVRNTTKDGKLRVRRVGDQVQLLEDNTPRASIPVPLGNTIYDVEFTADGRLLAIGADQGVAVFTVPDLVQYTFYRGQWSSSVAFDPTGHLLAFTGDNISLWSMRSNLLVATLPLPDPDRRNVSVTFSEDGQFLLAMVGTRVASAWAVGSTPEKTALAGHTGGVTTVVYSPDGQLIASVGKDLLVRFWDGRSGQLLRSCEGHQVPLQNAAFHPDSTLLATSDDSGHVLFWDARSGRQLGEIDASSFGKPWRMHFDPSGRYLLIGSIKGVSAWSVRREATGMTTERFFALMTPGRVDDIAIHPGGAEFVFAHGMKLTAYDLASSQMRTFPGITPWVYFNALHFDPDGRSLRYTTREERLGILDWSGNSPPRITDCPAQDMAGSDDGRWVAAATAHEGIVIYDLEGRRRWATLPAGTVAVWKMAWSPDGRKLAVAQGDGTMSLWDLDQVRSRLAEFGISVPSTAAAKPTAPLPPPLAEAVFERIVKRHRGQRHEWMPPTRTETLVRYAGPDHFPTPAEDWATWRGPRGDLVSRESSLAPKWPDAGPTMLWRAAVGVGYASPVACRGRLYLFSLHDGHDTLTAFDVLTGQILWSASDDSGWSGRYPGTRASPTIDGDGIYTYGGEGVLIRRDLATGKLRWRVSVLDQVAAKNLGWGISSTPLVAGNLVYVQGGGGGPTAVALNKESGRVEWTSEARGEPGYAEVVVADVAGTPQLLVVGNDAIYGMDPRTGTTSWTHPWKTRSDAHASTPTFSGEHLLATDDTALMLKVSPAGATAAWSSSEIGSLFQGAILDRGLAYVNAGGALKCFAWPKGEVRWSAGGNAALRLGGGGSMIRTGDRLITLAEDGTLSLVRADAGGAELISQAKIFATNARDFVAPVPLIYGGRLYVKGEQELRCYDISMPAK